MPNNPITDAALAELDRLHAAASKDYANGEKCLTENVYKALEFANDMHRAYPALRQRLLSAETRLAEAERERDELRAKNAAKEDLIREWARYVHTPAGERDTTVAERFWKDIEARFFGGEFDSLRWLTDRDARMKREGAAEWLEEKSKESRTLVMSFNEMQREAQRLREEGK